MEIKKPTIICLTPVKNEEWVLDLFLKTTSLWADYIIIADQNSTDGSRDIIRKYPKAILVENNSQEVNEPERQRLLLEEARKIEGQRFLIALDADEILSPEALDGKTWEMILSCRPGTVFQFQWATISPELKNYWLGYHLPYGYMDDGIAHTNRNFFHGTRLPTPQGNDVYQVNEFKLIHYQYYDSNRNASKQRWYQCLEYDNPSIARDAIDVFRKYHRNIFIEKDRLFPIPQTWESDYLRHGIDIFDLSKVSDYWFDIEVRKLFKKNGLEHYRKLDIWQDDYKCLDPRRPKDKIIHWWLEFSQPHYYSKAKQIDNLIRKITRY